MKKKLFELAIELHNEGYSPEEIAEELEISRATAYRWVEQHTTSIALAGIEEKKEVEYNDEEDFEGDIDEEVEITDSSSDHLVEVLERDHRVKTTKLKRQAMKEFLRLIEGLIEHTDGSQWTGDELRKVLHEVSDIIEVIEEACDFEEETFSDLSVYEIAQIIKGLFKTYTNLFPNGVEISWDDLKKDMVQKALRIESFEEVSFDTEDFYRQQARQKFIKFTEQIDDVNLTTLDEEEVEALQGELQTVVEAISEDLPEALQIRDEFDSELEVLGELKEYLKEYQVITAKAFFGAKLRIPDTIIKKIEDVITSEKNA